MGKRQVGVGVAALCALLAEGRNFSRVELNAMLDKLAASPCPKVHMGPQATCYAVAIPQLERFEHVCKKCGSHTVYPENRLRMANTLARYRDEAASLRTFGLAITLDESALCRKCKAAKSWASRLMGVSPRNRQAVGTGNRSFGRWATRLKLNPMEACIAKFARSILNVGSMRNTYPRMGYCLAAP